MGKRADLTMETFYDALAFSLANNVLLCFQLPSFCISMYMYAVAMHSFLNFFVIVASL